jgi:hypothetical protein
MIVNLGVTRVEVSSIWAASPLHTAPTRAEEPVLGPAQRAEGTGYRP